MEVLLTLWPAQALSLLECVWQQPSSAGNHGHDQAEKRIAFPVGRQQSVTQERILLCRDFSILWRESLLEFALTLDRGGPLYPTPA